MTEFLPLLHNILKKHLSEEVHSIQMLRNLGSVNSIFDINGQYIIRLNHDDPDKKIEYQKEYLCLQQAEQLGIPGPSVLAMGLENDFPYMLQAKLPGINGKLSSPDKRAIIWKSLGQYAAQYQSIQIIEDEEARKRAFQQRLESPFTL